MPLEPQTFYPGVSPQLPGRAFAPSPGFPNPPPAPPPTEEITVTASKPPPKPPAAPPAAATPEYPEPRPGVGERIFFPKPNPTYLRLLKLFRFLTGPWSPVADFGNLLLHSSDAGLTPEEEERRIQQTFFTAAMEQLALTPVATSEPNPYYNPEFQPDPYAEPAPIMQPIIVTAPRPQGLPGTVEAPNPLVGPALEPSRFPAANPGARALPSLLPNPALFPRAIPGVGPRVSPEAPISVSPLQPRIGSFTPVRFASIPSPLATSLPQPEPGEKGAPTSNQDCVKTKTGKKGKKRKQRETCYRGVYYERASGLTKYRREKIPCR